MEEEGEKGPESIALFTANHQRAKLFYQTSVWDSSQEPRIFKYGFITVFFFLLLKRCSYSIWSSAGSEKGDIIKIV